MIADRLPQIRHERGLSQEQLAEKAHVNLKSIQNIEQGKSANPRQTTIEKLAAALRCAVSDLTGEVHRSTKPDQSRFEFCSLAQFPIGFEPAVIVVGDRREDPPKTVGDLLAFAGSPCDLTFLPGLDLRGDTEIVSDKVFAQGQEEYLRDRFGDKHILTIGSPATNYLSRKLNETAVFRFHVEVESLSRLERFESNVREAWSKNRREGLQTFVKSGAQRRRINEALMTCRSRGCIDPTSEGTFTRGAFLYPNDDWGIVTLAPHPYRDPGDIARIAILVAGVHLPASMYGVRLLASRLGPRCRKPADWFKDHPCGGVFRIGLDDAQWEEKLKDRSPKWSTDGYEHYSRLIDMFDEMLRAKPEQTLLAEDSIERVKTFLRQLEAVKGARGQKAPRLAAAGR